MAKASTPYAVLEFRALLYNDPVAEGALGVLDVGGVTFSKPARPAT